MPSDDSARTFPAVKRAPDVVSPAADAIRLAEERAAAYQHSKGALTARERISLLVDQGSFVELDQFARHRCTEFGIGDTRPWGDGVVAGHATVNARPVCVYSQDFTVFGGRMGETSGRKILKIMDLAMTLRCPVIGFTDTGGARIQEGIAALAHTAELGKRAVLAAGVIPQISLIMGSCAGGAVYVPAFADFTVVADHAVPMFTGDSRSPAQPADSPAGGWVTDDHNAIAWVKGLLDYLPSNNHECAPVYADRTSAEPVVSDFEFDLVRPGFGDQAHDMTDVIERLVDDGEFMEVHNAEAPSMLCAFGRIQGRAVGIVANQPRSGAGVIDIGAAEKAARFVRFCDAFNLPMLTLVDVAGYLPGVAQDQHEVIRRGAKLIAAYAEATVPTVTVVTGKAYGGGYVVMGSKHLGVDINLAWSTAEIAVMVAESAVQMLHWRELESLPPERRAAETQRLAHDYRTLHASPRRAAERGYIDQIIPPSQTRLQVARALRVLRTKRRSAPAANPGRAPRPTGHSGVDIREGQGPDANAV